MILLKEAFTSKVNTHHKSKNAYKSLSKNRNKSKSHGFNGLMQNELHADSKFYNNFKNIFFLNSIDSFLKIFELLNIL